MLLLAITTYKPLLLIIIDDSTWIVQQEGADVSMRATTLIQHTAQKFY